MRRLINLRTGYSIHGLEIPELSMGSPNCDLRGHRGLEFCPRPTDSPRFGEDPER
jgi:hypothetical protein